MSLGQVHTTLMECVLGGAVQRIVILVQLCLWRRLIGGLVNPWQLEVLRKTLKETHGILL